MPGRKWTKEQRAELSLAIHGWKPWDRSTGPRTPKGKAVAAQNSLKHGVRSKVVKKYRRIVRENRRFGLFDIEAEEKIDTARETAIQYVKSLMNKNDVDSLVTGQDFIVGQTIKATRDFWKAHDRFVQFVRWDTYSLRSPRNES